MLTAGLLLASLLMISPPPAPPGPSASAPPAVEIEDVEAWVQANVVVGHYLQTGYNANAVAFIATDEVEVTGPRQVRIWLRFEHFLPSIVAGVEARSSRIRVEFDCERGLYRHLAYELYPQHNLAGRAARETTPDSPWMLEAPNSAAADSADIVCSVMDELAETAAAHDPSAEPAH